jgi:5-methylcytosine-specific restriction endonuclease McrA
MFDVFGNDSNKKDERRYLSKSEKNLVLDNQGNHCAICGKPLKASATHFDHIKPHSKGGKTTVKNTQALCSNCHSEKTNGDRIKNIKTQISKKKKASNPYEVSIPNVKLPKVELLDFNPLGYADSPKKRGKKKDPFGF